MDCVNVSKTNEQNYMDLEKALLIMRSGDGRLRPIIDYYANKLKQPELCPFIDDCEIGASVLYVLSEVPAVHAKILQSIKVALAKKKISGRGKDWAEEILYNHERPHQA